MKLSKNWLKMAEMYKRFAGESCPFDFSDEAAKEAFLFESTGRGTPSKTNGFLYGKSVMDITVKMWKQDLVDMILHIQELKEDFPEWFLEKVLPKGWVITSQEEYC